MASITAFGPTPTRNHAHVLLCPHRDNHVIGFREALGWSGAWVAAGLGFGVVLWLWQGGETAGTYYAG
jgi:tellurite resistance protein TerC